MAAVIFAACGSEEPATSAPTTAAATEAPQSTTAPTATAEAPETSVEVGNRSGQMAPDFDLTTVEGEQVSLSGLQGQPTVLYFFATW